MTASAKPPTPAQSDARLTRAGRTWSEDCRRVYERLVASRAPVKAYALVEALAGGGRAAYPATIYRALATLEEAGLVHRIASLNAFVACTAGEHGPAVAFMICRRCGSVEEADIGGHAPDPPLVAGFTLRSSVTEARGFCRTCTDEA